MNIYIPFTYIIGWSQHKHFYYGCKYAQGCQPSDLWTTYFTSSDYVEDFRKENGEPDIIKIHRTFSDKDSCVLFESEYLTKIDAKNNPLFLNEHNGAKGFTWDEKYELKRKETCLEKYGYEHTLQVPEIREKSKETCLEKYGVDHISKIPEVKEKMKQTCLEKYGVDHNSKIPEVKEKMKQTFLEKYGVDHNSKIPEVQKKMKEKRKETFLEKYGVDHISKIPEVKEKKKETWLEKYGYENPNQSPIIKEKKKETWLEKYGVDHNSKIPFLSIIETKKTYAKNSLSRYFPEFKQFY